MIQRPLNILFVLFCALTAFEARSRYFDDNDWQFMDMMGSYDDYMGMDDSMSQNQNYFGMLQMPQDFSGSQSGMPPSQDNNFPGMPPMSQQPNFTFPGMPPMPQQPNFTFPGMPPMPPSPNNNFPGMPPIPQQPSYNYPQRAPQPTAPQMPGAQPPSLDGMMTMLMQMMSQMSSMIQVQNVGSNSSAAQMMEGQGRAAPDMTSFQNNLQDFLSGVVRRSINESLTNFTLSKNQTLTNETNFINNTMTNGTSVQNMTNGINDTTEIVNNQLMNNTNNVNNSSNILHGRHKLNLGNFIAQMSGKIELNRSNFLEWKAKQRAVRKEARRQKALAKMQKLLKKFPFLQTWKNVERRDIDFPMTKEHDQEDYLDDEDEDDDDDKDISPMLLLSFASGLANAHSDLVPLDEAPEEFKILMKEILKKLLMKGFSKNQFGSTRYAREVRKLQIEQMLQNFFNFDEMSKKMNDFMKQVQGFFQNLFGIKKPTVTVDPTTPLPEDDNVDIVQ
ncbi:hypothetical protein SNEBB_001987 [Seison nebaliae]|nr:hypothetical protein SNEBB_001987 [Seison nebaliae]